MLTLLYNNHLLPRLIMTLAGLCCVVFLSKFANGGGWKEHPSVPDKPACARTPSCTPSCTLYLSLSARQRLPLRLPHPCMAPGCTRAPIQPPGEMPLGFLPPSNLPSGPSPSSGRAFTPGTAQLMQEAVHAGKGRTGSGGDGCSWHSAIAKAERKRSGESVRVKKEKKKGVAGLKRNLKLKPQQVR